MHGNLCELDLDHTADVQFHVWGLSLEEAFRNVAPCMANYITDLSTVDVDLESPVEFDVGGDALADFILQCLSIKLLTIALLISTGQRTICTRCCSLIWTRCSSGFLRTDSFVPRLILFSSIRKHSS